MEIGLLGAVEIRADGAPVPIGGQRLRAVLARLALDAGRLVTADALVDAIWGDDPPGGAVNALQSLVSRLRRALPDGAVESVPAGYRLAIDADAVDALHFEKLATAGRRALESGNTAGAATTLREALALWRGPALADVGDAPFRPAAVTRLEHGRLGALEDRIHADLALGRHTDVIPELEALTAEHPLRERPHAQLVLALGGASRQADALAVYDRIRRRLADELGVDPGPVLAAAHATVLGAPTTRAATLAPGPPVAAERAPRADGRIRGNLRPQLNSFVGRRTELTAVTELLTAERLVTLIGPGGAGKTRLAEETGARLADRSPGGVWMVALAPVGDGSELPQTVLTSLGRRQVGLLDRSRPGIDPPVPPDVYGILTNALSAGPTLLLLDNCEHLVEPVAELAHTLLLDCPELRILATSREPLGVPGERLHPVPSLDAPPPGSLTPAQAARYPAVQLLVDRAAAVRPGFALNPGNVAAVVEICRRLDGMPLALELAAARLRSLSPEQLADRLGDRFRLLTGGSRTALPRHQTLRAVVAWSWELLSVPEQVLWRRLSQSPAGATLEAAEQVCADDELPAAHVLETLASLVDKSLVELVADVDPPRYRMLETVRAFGAERLEDAGETARIRDAQLAYYLDLVESVEPRLRGPEQAIWTARLGLEYENITASLRWAVDQRLAEPAVRMVSALTWYLAVRGAHEEASRWSNAVLPLADDAPPVSAAVVRAFAGLMAASVHGDYLTARDEARRIAVEIAPYVAAPEAPPVLILADSIIGFFADQNDRIQASLGRARRHPDPWIRALAIYLEASMLENDGDLANAEPLFIAAREAFDKIGDRWGRGATLSSLASIRALKGDHPGAISALEEAAALIIELDGLDDLPRILLWLALEWARLGDTDRAKKYLDESTDALNRMADLNVRGFLGAVQATVLRLTGDVRSASVLLTEELARYRASPYGPPQIKSLLLADYCYVLLGLDDAEQARQHAQEALDAAEESRDAPILSGALDSAAAVALQLGDSAGAAMLLGVAARVRGLPDLGNPDVVRTRTLATEALGRETFASRYSAGERLPRAEAPEVARKVVAAAGTQTS
ncbi:BTAD domain-containing putative transcriptional regulator [Cryptosporangium aurantiacum]|uniref:Predicted ATPase n=1 Tax=Cryptosporangium aurantiacum TaxID=134849 RepID=A0A1M7MZ96_9ACTN|nr:BTAD domain-containing putative transcriptional regulator [Cryptosporangium aurantiacum]SHM96448.1 Predicted ATPase [Cryptosporangium aurantiacum]